jgi:hypothetical protein
VRSGGGHGGGDLNLWIDATARQFVFLARHLDGFQP